MPTYIRTIRDVEITTWKSPTHTLMIYFNDGGKFEHDCTSFSDKKGLRILRNYGTGVLIAYIDSLDMWTWELISFYNHVGSDEANSIMQNDHFDPSSDFEVRCLEDYCVNRLKALVEQYGEEESTVRRVSNWEADNRRAVAENNRKWNNTSASEKLSWIQQNERNNYKKLAIALCVIEAFVAGILIYSDRMVMGILVGVVSMALSIYFRAIIFRSLRVLIYGGIPAAILYLVGFFYQRSNPESNLQVICIILGIVSFAIAIVLEVKGKLIKKKPSPKRNNHTMEKLGDLMDRVNDSFL